MFAYCGNNPVARKEINGQAWRYSVTNQETEKISENSGQTTYCTTITFLAEYYALFGCPGYIYENPIYEVSFEYIVTNDGVIAYDNRQASTSCLDISPVRHALAQEMYETTRNQVDGSLQNRTASGISGELKLHYVAYKWGIFYENAKVSHIGSARERTTGFDSNAWLFELLFGWLD